jgi:hypothetical protein
MRADLARMFRLPRGGSGLARSAKKDWQALCSAASRGPVNQPERAQEAIERSREILLLIFVVLSTIYLFLLVIFL